MQMTPRNSMSGWYFSDEDLATAASGSILLNASMDLSNPCNLNCAYCFIEEKVSKRKLRFPDEMTQAETFAVIDDFAQAGAMTVNLVGAGEPTVDPLFDEVIERIAALGMTPVVFTNGIRLAESVELVQFLYRRGATVVLKFNSGNAELQDLVAGRAGYTRYRDEALQHLLNAGFASHEPTRLAFDIIALAGNYDEIPDIYSRCRAQNIYPILTDYIPTGRTDSGTFVGRAAIEHLSAGKQRRVEAALAPLSNAPALELYTRLRDADRAYGIEHTATPAYYCGGACTQLLGLYVDIHGVIWPCVARLTATPTGLQHTPLGNIRSGDTPSDLWKNSPYMNSLRRSYDGSCPYKRSFVETEQYET